MFIALIRLFRLIGQIISGEKFESDATDCRRAFFLLATMPIIFFFGNWLYSFTPKLTQDKSTSWLIVFIALAVSYSLVWTTISKKIPLFILLPLTVISWSLLLWFAWHH
jgi:hypothetical protein